MLTGKMMANAAQETKCVVAKKSIAQESQKHSRQPAKLDTTNSDPSDTDTGTHEATLDHDGSIPTKSATPKSSPLTIKVVMTTTTKKWNRTNTESE